MTRRENDSKAPDDDTADSLEDRSTAELDEYAESRTRTRVPIEGKDAVAGADDERPMAGTGEPTAEPPD